MRFRTSDPDRRRVRRGRGFRHLDADGAPPGAEDRAGAVALALPPAWRDAWIRPWPHGHIQAAVALAVAQPVARESRTARAKAVRRAVHEVSEYLGNTPAVCRASYIEPLVIERFEEDVAVAPAPRRPGEDGGYGRPATRGPVERAVLRLLA
ncbi:hypothetical protein [Streptomyces roseolus]|uniref:hypothetical protein n=1 Tax=Streptomyces roseolus TaxID=67358 RepID=UPI0016799240|nr:hypothetical protein [Streptomyces roseolus]GGR40828.1 hypothetical protein GCM10010282_36890 [Streptomyces roseolus]